MVRTQQAARQLDHVAAAETGAAQQQRQQLGVGKRLHAVQEQFFARTFPGGPLLQVHCEAGHTLPGR